VISISVTPLPPKKTAHNKKHKDPKDLFLEIKWLSNEAALLNTSTLIEMLRTMQKGFNYLVFKLFKMPLKF
jgi:hypothetical protein